MRILSFFTAFFLLLVSASSSAMASFSPEALANLGYQIVRTGEVHLPSGEAGSYTLLHHVENKIHALVAEFPSLPEPKPWPPLPEDRLFHHIFTTTVRPGAELTLHPLYQTNRRISARTKLPVTVMRARFTDGFAEPDVITTFTHADGRRYVLMMGAPQLRRQAWCPAFTREFSLILKEMQQLLRGTSLVDTISSPPVSSGQRFRQWIFESGYEPDCW